MPEGIILKGVGGFYDVLAYDGKNRIFTCKVRGVHRKEGGLTPLTGDRVSFIVLNEKKSEGHIDRILERKNCFVRPPVANIDQLAVVMAVTSPDPDLMLVDKLLVTCLAKDIRPLLIVNKIDLDHAHLVENLKKTYEGTGFAILGITKFMQEGYDMLHKELIGVTTAFAGQSGVGKSTILNRILNNWVMETGDVSERIRRGKHTTRHVQLFRLEEGGFVLDTPGFSSFSVSDVAHDMLDSFYPDFSDAIGNCRFKGCSHTGEPNCAVRSLLDEGRLEAGRYNRYTEIYKELKEAYENRYRR